MLGGRLNIVLLAVYSHRFRNRQSLATKIAVTVPYLNAGAEDAVVGGLFGDLLLEAARGRRGGRVGLARVALRLPRRHDVVVVVVSVAAAAAAVDVGRLRHHHPDALVQPLDRLGLQS